MKRLMRQRPLGGEHYNVNSSSLACVRAVLCAGLYPNVVRAGEAERKGRTPPLSGAGGVAVSLHPSSVNADADSFESRWLVYYEKVLTSRVFLRDSTMVTPYPLLLFGGELKVKHAEHLVAVDGWIEFGAPPRTAVLFRQLRDELNRLLLEKIKDPRLELEMTGRTISTIVQLLQDERGADAAGHALKAADDSLS